MCNTAACAAGALTEENEVLVVLVDYAVDLHLLCDVAVDVYFDAVLATNNSNMYPLLEGNIRHVDVIVPALAAIHVDAEGIVIALNEYTWTHEWSEAGVSLMEDMAEAFGIIHSGWVDIHEETIGEFCAGTFIIR